MTGERISLLCCVTQQRIRQACRLQSCCHAAAFCSSACPVLLLHDGAGYRCPLCCTEASTYVVDPQLTEFLTAYPDAESCQATRATHQHAGWRYSRPRSATRRRKLPHSTGGSHSCSHAGETSASRFDSTRVPSRVHVDGAVRVSAGRTARAALPARASVSDRRLARAARRERALLASQLEAARAALIRRSLHEDGSLGDALFHIGSEPADGGGQRGRTALARGLGTDSQSHVTAGTLPFRWP